MFNKNKKNFFNPNYEIITREQPLSMAAEAYRRIKTDLLFVDTSERIKVIQVCSSSKGEGKSTTALNIAETYAEDNKRVLIVDLDLRCPSLHRSFGIQNKNGVTDLLTGVIKLESAIKYNNKYNFSLLNSGSMTVYPTVILGSEKMEKLFICLRQNYDIIIVDCPPILAVSDALIISRLCDGCLFVISQEKTDKNAAKESIKIMKKNNINLLGIIFCEVDPKNKEYYQYYNDYNK